MVISYSMCPKEEKESIMVKYVIYSVLPQIILFVITIEKGFEHRGNALIIRFYDKLYQPNAVDERCDESWSLDNLKVRVISFE